MKKTGNYRICTAHDLALIFERAIRANAKDLSKNKASAKLVNKAGLGAIDNGEVWIRLDR